MSLGSSSPTRGWRSCGAADRAAVHSSGVPGLDLPGLGIAALARGWGCGAVDVETAEDLEQEFKTALGAGTTTVIVVRTQPQKAML